jgi:hypothetical protein
MTGYGDSLYGSDWYLASPWVTGTELRIGIRARIVKPVGSVPPVMDTIYYGLAQRFDLLQRGIQAFSLFNKIGYAKGSAETENGILPSLDDIWGKIYDLPRLTGESDDHYRMRLQTYVNVLVGCGTVPACQEVLDFLIGYPRATRITSIWPARALIDFLDVNAMRSARSRISLLNSVLPGMFAAGVDYELLLPYMDSYITAYVKGEASLESTIRAAVQTENELTSTIYALIATEQHLNSAIIAAIRAEREIGGAIKAAVRIERELTCHHCAAILGKAELPVEISAAVQSERELSCSHCATIQAEPELSCTCLAAVARTFELRSGILARVCYVYELESRIKAAVRAPRELTIGIRARIARRIE